MEKCNKEQDDTGVVSSLPRRWKVNIYKHEQRLRRQWKSISIKLDDIGSLVALAPRRPTANLCPMIQRRSWSFSAFDEIHIL